MLAYATAGGAMDALSQTPAEDAPRRLLRYNDAEYEAAHGMEPLADLHAERDTIADEYAALKPKFGPAKMWEHERKALLSLIELDVRRDWPADGPRMTEGAVDARAHDDPRYKQFLADGLEAATRYELLAIKMGNLEERSSRGQVIGRLRSAEMQMAPQGA
jgi:hypothetical protein